MKIDKVIEQLKAYAAMFEGRVAGAADFAQGVESQVWLTLPAAYVIPLDEDATENVDTTSLRQYVTERIGVIVEIDNSTDRRGQAAATSIDDARTWIFKALLNWHIDPNRSARGLYYGGGQLREFDRARLFYQFEFCLDSTISYDDGFQVGGTPLTQFDKTYVDAQTGTQFPIQHVIPPTP
jgi:hypothetical protein